MRTRNFLVPQELIENFADAIEEHGFDNCIVGTTPDSEIEISIDYETNQKKVINQLQDLIDEHNYEEDDDEEEEEDEDED